MPIAITFDQANDRIYFVVTDQPPMEEFKKAIRSFYRKGPSHDTLWDFGESTLAHIPMDQVEYLAANIGKVAIEHQEKRQGGKTAVVVSRDIDYGIVSQYIAFAADRHQTIRAFRSREKALEWLEED